MTKSQAFMSRNKPLLVVLAVIGGLVVLAYAAGCVTGISCSFDRTYLPGLKADPMAIFEPSGADLIRSDNQAEGTTLGKPTHARLSRTFQLVDQEKAADVLGELVAYAESIGWVFNQRESDLYEGSKGLEAGLGRIYIILQPEDPLHDPDGPLAVRVSLDYDRGIPSN